MKQIFQRIGTVMLVFLIVIGIILEPQSAMEVSAACSSGIKNNGTGGVSIDINSAPYTTFQSYSWGQYAYTNEGCAWFASARVNQLTGKGNIVRAGTNWWNGGNGREGFQTGQTPSAPAIVCWSNHVAILEKIEGSTAYISEGGTGYSDAAHGYCGIFTTNVSNIASRNAGFLGYVYLGSTNPGSLSISARSNYYTDEDVVVSWNTPANTASYGFTLRYNPKSGEDLIDHYVTGNSYNIGRLGTGNYRLWMKPYSANGTGGTAVYVDFSVTNRPVTYVTGITLNQSSLSLKVGQTATITASVQPGNATNKNVTWTSSNAGVVSVSNGTVKAVSAGSATITAKAADGSGKTASCKVTVTKTHTHQYAAKVTKAATCKEEGIKTYTCSCGSTYTEKIAKTAHKVVKDAAIVATCTSAGRTEGSHCSVCGTVITPTTVIPAKGHTITRTVTVKATTQKDGSITKTCGVCGATEKTAIYRPAQIALAKKSYTYNGQEQKPSVVLWDSKGNQIGTTNYTVAYSNNRNVGKAKITVTLSGNYFGTLTKTFNICPSKTEIVKLTRKSKGFQVKWKKQSNQTSGYEIQYSDNSKFSKNRTKTVDISKKTAVSKDVKKLKAKKKYYVRVRTYKKVKVNGKTTKIYSGWSKVKMVVTK